MREKRLAARYFMLSFAIGFLVLSVAAMTAVLLVPPSMASADSLETHENGSYLPTNDDALNLLLILDEGESDSLFALVRFDPLRGQIPVAMLPPGTLVGTGSRTVPIGALYRYSGAGTLVSQLQETLGVAIDRRAVFDGAGVVRLVDLLGGVRYQLREPVEMAGESLGAGNYQLSGSLYRELLRYPAYRQGERGRCAAAAQLVTGLINQNSGFILSGDDGEADALFQQFVNLAQTDLSVVDYQQRGPAMKFLARLMGEAAFPVALAGDYAESFGAFALSDEAVEQLQGIYSPA